MGGREGVDGAGLSGPAAGGRGRSGSRGRGRGRAGGGGIARAGAGTGGGIGDLTLAIGLGLTVAIGLAVLAAAEELQVFDDDLGGVAIAAVLGLPLTGLQAAFEIDLAALGEVLLGDLGGPAEADGAVPFGLFLGFAGVLVLPLKAGGDGQGGDHVAALGVAEVGVLTEAAEDLGAVDAGHGELLRG